jgi:HD-GYP domain-containing protein (c-di-GMP phosphodiesterase class II)
MLLSSPVNVDNQVERELGSFAEIIECLAEIIDLAEGNVPSHSLRTCATGMRIGRQISLPLAALSDLYYALLLKDIGGTHTQRWEMTATGGGGVRARRLLREGWGAMSWLESSKAARDMHHGEFLPARAYKLLRFVWQRSKLGKETVDIRCAAASSLLNKLGVSAETRAAVCSIEERWDGRGAPEGMQATSIPVISQIVKLAQSIERFRTEEGDERVIPLLHRRCRGWFDPGLVAAATWLLESTPSWWLIDGNELRAYLLSLEPREHMVTANSDTIHGVCEVFAEVVDARSRYSSTDSSRLADLAARMARMLKMSEQDITRRCTALRTREGKIVQFPNCSERPQFTRFRLPMEKR